MEKLDRKHNDYRPVYALLGLFCLAGVVVLAACLLNRQSMPLVGRELNADEREEVIARNSPLTQYVYLTANAAFPRERPIDTITIHHMAGTLELENLGLEFAKADRRASANYGIDVNGRVGLFVEEANRAWTSSNVENDSRAVTIEVANDEEGGIWHVSDASYQALIDLCVDICRRNGIQMLYYTGDAKGNLTTHKMFSDTECPGFYLESKLLDIANEVNTQLKNS